MKRGKIFKFDRVFKVNVTTIYLQHSHHVLEIKIMGIICKLYALSGKSDITAARFFEAIHKNVLLNLRIIIILIAIHTMWK